MNLRLPSTARLLRTSHLAMTIGWMVMIPVSIWTGWWHSVNYVTLLSLWALVSTEWGAYQGSRAEVVAEATKVEHADVVEDAGSVGSTRP